MGQGESTPQGNNGSGGGLGNGIVGFHVLRVAENSPAAHAKIDPFFDFIVGAQGDQLGDEIDLLTQVLESNEGREISLQVYSTKRKQVRDVYLTPSRTWSSDPTSSQGGSVDGEPSLLGLSLRLCNPHHALEQVWHVLEVLEGSPAQSAGLVPFGDWIIGYSGGVLRGEGDFYDVVEAHTDKPLRLFVYNADYDVTREAILVPNRTWGGEGLLGAGVGYGLLHRIPKPRDQPQQQQVDQSSTRNQFSNNPPPPASTTSTRPPPPPPPPSNSSSYTNAPPPPRTSISNNDRLSGRNSLSQQQSSSSTNPLYQPPPQRSPQSIPRLPPQSSISSPSNVPHPPPPTRRTAAIDNAPPPPPPPALSTTTTKKPPPPPQASSSSGPRTIYTSPPPRATAGSISTSSTTSRYISPPPGSSSSSRQSQQPISPTRVGSSQAPHAAAEAITLSFGGFDEDDGTGGRGGEFDESEGVQVLPAGQRDGGGEEEGLSFDNGAGTSQGGGYYDRRGGGNGGGGYMVSPTRSGGGGRGGYGNDDPYGTFTTGGGGGGTGNNRSYSGGSYGGRGSYEVNRTSGAGGMGMGEGTAGGGGGGRRVAQVIAEEADE